MQDNVAREKMGLPKQALDSRFLGALKAGIPKCSGVALGVDRLIMLAMEKENINEVISFGIDVA